MQRRKSVRGTLSSPAPRANGNGFLNRSAAVRIGSGSQSSENTVTAKEVACISAGDRGIRAARAAGRRPVDFQQFGAMDRAVIAEIGRYQALRRRGRADRDRLRAALIPYIQLAGGVA